MLKSELSGGWIGNRVIDGLLFGKEMRLSFSAGLDSGFLEEKLFEKIFSWEEAVAVRHEWINNPTEALLQTERGRELADFLRRIDDLFVVTAYSPNEYLEELAKANPHIILANISKDLYKKIDNKFLLTLNFSKFCPESFLISINELDYRQIIKKIGEPFLIQLEYSIGGDGTFIIRDNDQFNDLRLRRLLDKDQAVRICRYIEGPTFNINAAIVETDVGPAIVKSYPSLQIVGLPDCTAQETKYCGNDFTAMKKQTDSIIQQIADLTETIGNILFGFGYRGIFGLDFILDENKILLLEINPRFQGSTLLTHRLELLQRKNPLIRYHLAAYGIGRVPRKAEILKVNQRMYARPDGCQLYFYNTTSHIVSFKSREPDSSRGTRINFAPSIPVYMDLALPIKKIAVPPEAPLTRCYSFSPDFTTVNSNFGDISANLKKQLDFCVETLGKG